MKKLLTMTLLAWTITTPLSGMESNKPATIPEKLKHASSSYAAFKLEYDNTFNRETHQEEFMQKVLYRASLLSLIDNLKLVFRKKVEKLLFNQFSKHLLKFFLFAEKSKWQIKYSWSTMFSDSNKICINFLDDNIDIMNEKNNNWFMNYIIFFIRHNLGRYQSHSHPAACSMLIKSLKVNFVHIQNDEDATPIHSDAYIRYLFSDFPEPPCAESNLKLPISYNSLGVYPEEPSEQQSPTWDVMEDLEIVDTVDTVEDTMNQYRNIIKELEAKNLLNLKTPLTKNEPSGLLYYLNVNTEELESKTLS